MILAVDSRLPGISTEGEVVSMHADSLFIEQIPLQEDIMAWESKALDSIPRTAGLTKGQTQAKTGPSLISKPTSALDQICASQNQVAFHGYVSAGKER